MLGLIIDDDDLTAHVYTFLGIVRLWREAFRQQWLADRTGLANGL